MENYFFNVKIFDWNYLHLTAQTNENYFKKRKNSRVLKIRIEFSFRIEFNPILAKLLQEPRMFAKKVLVARKINEIEASSDAY